MKTIQVPMPLFRLSFALFFALLCFPHHGLSQTITPISCGQTVTGTTTIPTTNVEYSFSGSAGQKLIISFWGARGGVNFEADIYNPSFQLVSTFFANGGGNSLSLTLTNTGTYFILLHDQNYVYTNSYLLTLQTMIGGGCASLGAIACGQPAPATNTTVYSTEMDGWTFNGTAGQTFRFAFWAARGGVAQQADFYDPTGRFVTNFLADGGGNSMTLTLPASGTFTILVHDSGYNYTNTYALSLQSVVGGGCNSLGAIACGQATPTTHTTTYNTEMAAYSLTGTAGQTLKFVFSASRGGVAEEVDIYGPTGLLLTNLQANGGGNSMIFTFTNSGTFTLLIHDAGFNYTNSYALSVQTLIAGGCSPIGTIVCGQTPPVTNTTTYPTDSHGYTFTASAGQPLQFVFWAARGGVAEQADFYDPTGRFVTNLQANGGGNIMNVTFTNSGTYTILVHDSGYNYTNTYAMGIQTPIGGGCNAALLACGQTVNSNITSSAQIVAYAYGTGGGPVIFSFSGGSYGGARFDLYDPTGNKVFAATPGQGPNTNLSAGTYTLLVHDAGYSGIGGYGFSVTCPLAICNPGIVPSGPLSVPASGANGTIAITNESSTCPWTNTSGASWLHVSPGNGLGNGTVSYSVDANCNPSNRVGPIYVAGYTVWINQSNPVPFDVPGHDIGSPGLPGSFSFTNCGVYTVNGSGEGTDGTADVFYFLSEPWSGDAQIIARLQSLQGGDATAAEAGIMMRESLDGGARQASLTLSEGGTVVFRRRLAANGPETQTSFHGTNFLQGTNYLWLRLMRLGGNFIAHYSTNGLNWQYMWFTTLSMSNQMQIGLAVTAHHHAEIATAMFDNVSASGPSSLGPWTLPGPALFQGGEIWSHSEFQRVGGFDFLLQGVAGDYFGVYGSSNLAAPFASWSPIVTATNTYGVMPVLDTNAPPAKNRFYRAKRLGP